MSKLKRFAIPIFGVLFASVILWAADGDIHTWTGMGSRRDTVEFKINEPTVGTAADFIPGTDATNSLGTASLAWDDVQTEDITIQDDAIIIDLITRRSSTVAHSTSVASTGMTYPCLLMGTTASVEGSLLVAYNAGAGTSEGVVVTVANSVIDQTTWIGIAASAVSTGSVVNVYTSGFVFALTTGTVTEGQTLVSTDETESDGYLEADATPTTGADVGVALEDGTASGGLTLIRLR